MLRDTRGFNRYSHALKYVDEDGNNPFLKAAGIGTLPNTCSISHSIIPLNNNLEVCTSWKVRLLYTLQKQQ